MANYKALLEGDRSREAKAWELLNALRDDLGNDKNAWDALGNMSAERADMRQAEQAFRRVLEVDPHDLTALSNLGILLAKQGKLQEGEALLREGFDRNMDIPGVAMNLARVQCMKGDGAAARNTLSTALTYCPSDDGLRRLLKQIGNCSAPDAK